MLLMKHYWSTDMKSEDYTAFFFLLNLCCLSSRRITCRKPACWWLNCAMLKENTKMLWVILMFFWFYLFGFCSWCRSSKAQWFFPTCKSTNWYITMHWQATTAEWTWMTCSWLELLCTGCQWLQRHMLPKVWTHTYTGSDSVKPTWHNAGMFLLFGQRKLCKTVPWSWSDFKWAWRVSVGGCILQSQSRRF